jgi:uncharacterized protein
VTVKVIRTADISRREARRIVLRAQGFADRRPRAEPGRPALRRVLGRTALLQIDSVNVVVRAHYMPTFSRIGPYPTATLDRMVWRRPRELFEYWGHEASMLPVALHPLLRWRMAKLHPWGRTQTMQKERPDFLRNVLREVRERGPIGAGELASAGARRLGPWWDRSDEKIALEVLFWAGEVTTARRRGFERLYDLPERVLPPEVLAAPTPSVEDAQRALVALAGASLGVGTERDLRDYFRLRPDEARPRVLELVEEGVLRPVTVEGWRQPAYLHRDASVGGVGRRVRARALLAPFDPLVWERDRTERLFGMRYRIEIYVPEPQRVHGYYVMPFLLDEDLVARVDLKADRAGGVLRVVAAHIEEGRSAAACAAPLAEELASMAGWLGLGGVVAAGSGELDRALRAATQPGEQVAAG